MIKSLFLHGGPGLNSEAERRMLASDLEKDGFDFHFWNEPSLNREDGYPFNASQAFTGWLKSAEKAADQHGPFQLLVGLSFGALAALHLVSRNPRMFRQLVLISPTLDMMGTFRKMMEMAAKDYTELGQETVASEILELRTKGANVMDAPTRRAMDLVYQDPKLFGHYWVDPTVMGKWASVLGESRFGVDFVSQAAVLEEFARAPEPICGDGADVQAVVMIGDKDPVVEVPTILKMLSSFCPKPRLVHFSKSGHFPHLEEPDAFIRSLKEFCATSSKA